MATLQEITVYLDKLLDCKNIPDYCPNGLQIESSSQIRKLITGVSISQELITEAIAKKADAILVHHGFFWKGEDPCLTGIKAKRIAELIRNNISLLAYHLPLDMHPLYGNNVKLGQLLNIKTTAVHDSNGVKKLLYQGEIESEVNPSQFAEHLAKKLQRQPLFFPQSRLIKKVAWCTGAAQDLIMASIDLNCDAFITGEVSERTFYQAQEGNINFYAAGHHATERYGVIALGTHLEQMFDIEHEYIEVANPI